MNGPYKLPNLAIRTCSNCLYDEDAAEFSPVCSFSPTGKHRLCSHRLWAAVVLSDWFSIRSERQAISVFGESCFDASAYVLARSFTPEEVEMLKNGGSIELHVVPGRIA